MKGLVKFVPAKQNPFDWNKQTSNRIYDIDIQKLLSKMEAK